MAVAALVVFILASAVGILEAAPNVSAPWGRIVGQDAVSVGGRPYSKYLAIPFALPPTGDRRWQKPVASAKLSVGQIHNKTQLGPLCPQGFAQGVDEDCLTLNVYVPAQLNSVPKKVMVYIHGGGFSTGGAKETTPSELVTENDVIVVVIQYRLAFLGFLASGDDNAPGNYGLWDQRLALQWVQENIGAFGGDASDVTVFGESAGSLSLGHLFLSPTTKGMFSRVILQSGTPYSEAGVSANPERKLVALANATGCLATLGTADSAYYMMAGGREREERKRMLACLRTQDWRTLNQASARLGTWGPVLDGELVTRRPEEALEDPDYLISVGAAQRDVLLGVVNFEGGLLILINKFTNIFKFDLPFARQRLNGELIYRFPDLKDQETRANLLVDIAEFFYLKPNNGTPAQKDVLDIAGDAAFVVPTVRFARALARAQAQPGLVNPGKVYMYYFNHFPVAKAGQEFPGTAHAEDLIYQFDPYFSVGSRDQWNADDVAISVVWRSVLSSFAKTGTPRYTSPQSGQSETFADFAQGGAETFLDVTPTPSAQRRILQKRVDLWLELLPSVHNKTQPQQASWWPSWGQAGNGWMPFSFHGKVTLYKLH